MARSRLFVLMASWLFAFATSRTVHAHPGGTGGHASGAATVKPGSGAAAGASASRAPSGTGSGARFEGASEPELSSEEKDCQSLAWSCDNSSEVSKASARCACGDSDGNCAREACRRAEEHPSAAVRREQTESRRRVDACLHATAAPASANAAVPGSARRERERPRSETAPTRR